MAHRKKGSGDPVSGAFIQEICALYGDCYDDRLEDSRPTITRRKNGQAGAYLRSEMLSGHKSLVMFQKELADKYNICLSTTKIRKILISGGCWTTERSREVQALYDDLTQSQTEIDPETVIGLISQKLGISKVAVNINLPYINGVYCLEERSKNAHRCARYREKKKDNIDLE